MQDYITDALVITEQLSAKEPESGTVCLVMINKEYKIVTLDHIDPDGNWVSIEHGVIQKPLLRLSALLEDKSYPIAFKDWKRILLSNVMNTTNLVKFSIKPYKFKEGKYVKTCSNCAASFLATKSQPLCKTCCVLYSTATLFKPDVIKKNKRPRLVKPNKVKLLMKASYLIGKTEDFDEEELNLWIKNKLDKE